MKLPTLSFKLPALPKKVLISIIVLAVSLTLFAVLFLTLEVAHEQAIAENGRLKGQIAQTSKAIDQARIDAKYVEDNRERYEALLKSDRLLPHTRRDAVTQLESVATQRGITQMGWEFAALGEKSLTAAASQVKTAAYHVNVEAITLHLGAPLDGSIYNLLIDIAHNFPGSAILAQAELQRPGRIAPDTLQRLGRQGDPGLVKGEIKLIWRTAQSNEPEKKP